MKGWLDENGKKKKKRIRVMMVKVKRSMEERMDGWIDDRMKKRRMDRWMDG